MTAFVIEVRHEHFTAYETQELVEAGWIIHILKKDPQCTFEHEYDNARYIKIYRGEGCPTLIVTLLAAIAQAHTLRPILDKISRHMIIDDATETYVWME